MKLLLSLFVIPLLAYVPNHWVTNQATSYAQLKVIEQYEVNAKEYEANPHTAKRYLSYVYLYDKMGKVAERWDLTNDSAGASYHRNVFAYDRFGRTAAEWVYVSSRTAPGQYFSISRLLRQIKVIPELSDTLSTITLKSYDQMGNLVEESISDAEGKLKQRTTKRWDANGNLINYHDETGDGSVICEWNTVFSEKNLESIQTYRNCGVSTVTKAIIRRDRLGRQVLSEQYSPAPKGDGSIVLTSRVISTYSGDLTNLDWTIWSPNGEPRQRLLIVDKADNEISRKEFALESLSVDGSMKWIPAEETIRELEFDKMGNITKEVWRKRSAPDKPFRCTYVIERVVGYY